MSLFCVEEIMVIEKQQQNFFLHAGPLEGLKDLLCKTALGAEKSLEIERQRGAALTRPGKDLFQERQRLAVDPQLLQLAPGQLSAPAAVRELVIVTQKGDAILAHLHVQLEQIGTQLMP